MLEALEPHEHDFQEFKGTAWIVDADGAIQDHFLIALSKQVSAFANGAGGRLFIGLDDHGDVDGGVPTRLRGGTREWLEDVAPSCVDPPLQRCNVFEVAPGGPGTRIQPHHGVYVIEIPGSIQAPHQSKDHRYYLRIAGKSRPMGHVHVQDVIRRTQHPVLELSRLGPYGDFEPDDTNPLGPQAFVQLRCFVTNRSRRLASHVGFELVMPRPFAGAEVRRRMRANGECHHSQTPGEVRFFRYHGVPVFPSQETYAVTLWTCVHGRNLAQLRAGAVIGWRIYADDAEPAYGERALASFQVVLNAMAWVEQQLGDAHATDTSRT